MLQKFPIIIGTTILIMYNSRLFQKFPGILAFFKTLKDMDFDTMKKSSKLKAHTINFKMGINSYVDNLDDTECLVILIQKTTEKHYDRAVKVEHFQVSILLNLKGYNLMKCTKYGTCAICTGSILCTYYECLTEHYN